MKKLLALILALAMLAALAACSKTGGSGSTPPSAHPSQPGGGPRHYGDLRAVQAVQQIH